jgi:hypothetical protein
MAKQGLSVKTAALIALAAITLSFMTTPVFTMPLNPGAPLFDSLGLVLVAKKSEKKPKGHNYNAAKNYIPGRVRTPYGYKDCIGWWERHGDGRMQCHGQMIGSY